MIIKVKLDDQTYEVEIDNLHARPVIAFVNGEPFEVWPEDGIISTSQGAISKPVVAVKGPPLTGAATSPVNARTTSDNIVHQATGTIPNGVTRVVRAPIPGVITSVAVQKDDVVSVGQQLCVLEAMKMNNSIRSSRAGKIGTVNVSVGQHVKHNDILVEYSE